MSAAPQIRTALTENLKALHLPAMRDCFEQAAQQAEKETLSYEQYLLGLSERECESRRCNRIAALLRDSALPREKTMANFDLKRLPVKAGRQLKALVDGATQAWSSEAESLLSRNRVSFAMRPIYELLDSAGPLAKFRAEGYTVEGP